MARLLLYVGRSEEAIGLLQRIPDENLPDHLATERLCVLVELHATIGNREEAELYTDILTEKTSNNSFVLSHLPHFKALLDVSTEQNPAQVRMTPPRNEHQQLLSSKMTRSLENAFRTTTQSLARSVVHETCLMESNITRFLMLIRGVLERVIGVEPQSILDPPSQLLEKTVWCDKIRQNTF